MASIQQYRDATWRVIIRKAGFKSVSKTFKTKVEATRWATQIEASMLSGVHRNDLKEARTQTVRSLFERWQVEVAILHKGAKADVNRCKQLIKNADFMPRRLDQISAEDLRDWRDHRLTQVKPSSVNRELNVISSVFSHAMKEWSAPLATNPVELIKRPGGAEIVRDRRWTDERVKIILDAANWKEDTKPKTGEQYAAWALLVAVETAMRLGELVKIKAGDFYPVDRYVALRDTKNSDDRTVPLTKKAHAYLTFLTKDLAEDERVFPYLSGSLGKFFRDVRDTTSLKDVDLTFHDSRHEGATRLSKKLANVLELSAVTGHRSLQSLKRYYNPAPGELSSKLD